MFLFLLLNILLAQTPSTPRIVSLNPALTEILFKLDLGNHIVGTTTYSDYPEAAKKIPIIGSYFKPNIEKIIKKQNVDLIGI